MDKTQSSAPNTNLKPLHHSDGSELVPAEVQAHQRLDAPGEGPSSQESAISGSTIDDEGRINNFAVEPKVYPSEYPSPREQRRYVYWGIAATLLVATLVLVSRFVS
ncbi:photosystem II assembly protein Psb34 [Halomicronema sp. CCY15110]|uniref:photosystem II assembly protein Psb34 n=1 Tax=Halomicronema sp. CCY15110 TaxID=2767773 RepID=UPI00194EDCC0|nr:ssl1498 family light-harvesting-like protein [Halomicronema sp. CCY15110]